jgi:hypothetical protein
MADPFGLVNSGLDTTSKIFGSEGGGNKKSNSNLLQNTTTVQDVGASNFDTEQLLLDPAAIQQIIRDVLGGADGLASIFAGEQSAGLYNSSVAAQAAGDLTAKLTGELAKITGKNVKQGVSSERTGTFESLNQAQRGFEDTKNKKGGAFSGLF